MSKLIRVKMQITDERTIFLEADDMFDIIDGRIYPNALYEDYINSLEWVSTDKWNAEAA